MIYIAIDAGLIAAVVLGSIPVVGRRAIRTKCRLRCGLSLKSSSSFGKPDKAGRRD